MIHESAYIDPQAQLGANVRVGPNCYVGPHVVLGDDCVLHNNVTITGITTCGRENVFFPQSVVGVEPQDLKFKGGETSVTIGDDNVFREHVTVHAGTEVAGGVTEIGSHNRFLVGVHVAHDCRIGDGCILSNYVQLAGHVHLEDRVTMGGIIGIHHFTTVGTLAYIGGLTRIVNDVPPYMIVEGNPSRVRGFNETGMKRWGFTEEQIQAIRRAYRLLFSRQAENSGRVMKTRLTEVEGSVTTTDEVSHLCQSISRSLQDGVYGRYLEHARRDSDQDRSAYYSRRASEEPTS
jgi:UDP-N-acetylglucosamine acyltransferase